MKNIQDRITIILDYYKMNAGEFAKKLGVQKSSISHLLSGRNKPSFLFLTKLIDALPEINIEWFISGKGEMIKNNHHRSSKRTAIKEEVIAREQIDQQENIKENSQELEENKTTEILTGNMPQNIILIYDDDSFKFLKNKK